jgi:hypothetical protein
MPHAVSFNTNATCSADGKQEANFAVAGRRSRTGQNQTVNSPFSLPVSCHALPRPCLEEGVVRTSMVVVLTNGLPIP